MADPRLESEVESIWRAAQEDWPAVSVPADRFASYLNERAPKPSDRTGINASQLYLACGCALGLPAALAAFEEAYFGQVNAVVRKLRNASIQLDEARQAVRMRLFIGDPPRITAFSGRGDLHAWVRVVASRTVLDLLRGRPPKHTSDDELLELPSLEDSPELACLKDLFGSRFKVAYREALAELSSRERNLIRFRFVDGLGAEELASLYKVHGATLRRWLASARERLREGITTRLKREFKMNDGELESALRQVRSGLSVSLSRLKTESDRS